MAIDLESNNSELVRAAWTAMDQTYGTVAPGFSLQPIDKGGKAMKIDGGVKLFLGRTGTRALCGLYLALLGLGVSLPAHAYKMSDVVPERAYPIQEIGVLGGFEWLDENRLIALRSSHDRGPELAIYDVAQQQWKTVLPARGFYSMNMACISKDQSVVQINVRVTKDAARSESRQVRLEPQSGIAVSALEPVPSDKSGCGKNWIDHDGHVIRNDWYDFIPKDQAIYPLGRKEDGYLDFGKWPMERGYTYGHWVKADGTRVDSKAAGSDLRGTFGREDYYKFMPYLNGYQLNQRCETDQYPTRPPLFFFLRSGAAEVEAVPMPIGAMRKIGFCRQTIALKDGYFIDASGWPAPSNGAMFGLFHILNDQPYLIAGTANRYLVDVTRVSPDGCKVAFQVAGNNYKTRYTPDTRIVNFCAQP